MNFLTACMMPFIDFGDVSQCWLDRGHRGDCDEANRARRELGYQAFGFWLAGNGEVS